MLNYRRRLVWIALVAVTLCLVDRSARAAAETGAAACDIQTTERIVAVADVHGAYDRFVAILRAAGLIDGRRRWSGGRTIFVQMGDILDRGPDSRRALDLLRRLESEALRAGGRVHALLGNHEVMRMRGDFRYTALAELVAFRSSQPDVAPEPQRAVGDPFPTRSLEETPPGAAEMRIAFGPDGEYGRWLRGHDTMVKINGIVFVHGGISPPVAGLGCTEMNAKVRSELKTLAPAADLQQALIGVDGPLWYRGLALEDESVFATEVDTILRKLDARTIVVGHTPVDGGRVAVRFGGRIVFLDTGMLDGVHYPGGRASALEIKGDTFTAIYDDRRDVLLKAAPGGQPPRPGSSR